MSFEKPLIFTDLSFSYSNQPIIDNYSFEILGNQWVAIVGVNGSGKSTLLKLILGLETPHAGQLSVFDNPAGNFSGKHMIGSSLQDIDFPSSEKVREVLKFISLQYPDHHPIDEIIADFQLQDFINKPCGQLSGGMKRRLSLACAFMGKSKLILLDEPSTGLDVESRSRLLKNIKKYQVLQKALVLMISHHPEEVVEYVDQFFHLKNGKIQTVTTKKMAQSTKMRKIEFFCKDSPQLPKNIRMKATDNHYEVIVEESDQFIRDMVAKNIPFTNLLLSKIGAEELLGEIL